MLNKPRIILFGNNTIAVNCLNTLVSHKENIIACVCEYKDSGKDGWQKSFKRAVEKNKIKLLKPKNISDPKFIARIKNLKPDIIFSVQCRSIMKRRLIDIPPMGVVNLHFAYLPRYRGCYPIAWAIINGEKHCGVTFHYIDSGVDSGDIIYQKKIPILHSDTGRTLFDKCTRAGSAFFKKNYKKILNGTASRKKQDESKALYYNIKSLNFSKKKINWNQDNRKLFNWIRAFIFPPFQYPETQIKGKLIKVKAVKIKNKKGFPGEILSLSANKIEIATLTGSLIITPSYLK